MKMNDFLIENLIPKFDSMLNLFCRQKAHENVNTEHYENLQKKFVRSNAKIDHQMMRNTYFQHQYGIILQISSE